MQTPRLFLISSPPLSLSNVFRHVFADLRLNAKMATQSLISCLLVIAKLVPRPVIASLNTLFLPRVRGPFAAFPETYLALGSIAAPTTATAFLLVSLSKMPRSILGTLRILPRGISDQG